MAKHSMVKFKEKFQLSKHIDLKTYNNYMKNNPIEQRIMLDFIIEKFKKNKSLKIVEFGAGTGRFTKLLLNAFPKLNLILIDPDKKCCLELNKLKNKHPQLKIIQSNAEDFKSKSQFDIIVMATAFHHISFQNKLKFLRLIKKLLKKDGIFLCEDNFIAEYTTKNERNQVLTKSMNKWIQDAKKNNNKKELEMAQKMKSIIFRKDCGGEYFICPSEFNSYVEKSKLKIKGKINVTNTNPLDIEKYFYLIMK